MYCVGVDIIEIDRIERVTSRWGERFLKRVYTDSELGICRNRASALAVRFAAKEAVMKLLGTGTKGVGWREIEVLSNPDGKPLVYLRGRAKKRAEELGLGELAISLSHSRQYAIASVVGGRNEKGRLGEMLLAIDVGNTGIAFGVFEGETLRATWNVATDIRKTADEYAVLLLNLLPREGLTFSDIDHAIIASVVPPLEPIFEEMSKRYFGTPALVVGPGVKTGVRICTDNPREVGADRVVNAAAAHRLYGGPVIVIDFGTATTVDAISKEGDYLGGAIAPGIGIAAEALFERASKLPRIELIPPQRAIGKNTITAMQSGVIFGYVGLIEGLVARIRQELGEARVVATGGLADVIAKETKVVDEISPHLTLLGLRLIHELNR